ncbi:MAG TPA: hypothetical protein DD397_06800 [Hyphomonas sp.]|jgi:hypothetical protein|uniref:hypothetical protein n=1 Tax=Hyphomonas sp. TaxID=87 RepID=UPI000E908541|nr:hypothetical protein [Hyphomonas sp.]QDP49076.1 MAG: hypothetical protein Unbinned4811contig1001_21 [Prokaryotic dsDNA virus sp.]HBN92254.1 hypothetical protein [Hyphomonas sp.]|tara:strand:+ start:9265 stop:9510 length:246 start_codon:yes stop_codon:yes gene_type:complete
MADVIQFNAAEIGDGISVPVNGVLEGAKSADLVAVTVIGWTKEGERYIASSHGTRDVIADLELAKMQATGAELAKIYGEED